MRRAEQKKRVASALRHALGQGATPPATLHINRALPDDDNVLGWLQVGLEQMETGVGHIQYGFGCLRKAVNALNDSDSD